MATADHQIERAYQKQLTVFLNKKSILQGKSKKNLRYVRNVGLGFKTPREAIDGSYIDKICPFKETDVEIGDVVTVGECRPLSKTVKYNVLKVTKNSSNKKGFSKA